MFIDSTKNGRYFLASIFFLLLSPFIYAGNLKDQKPKENTYEISPVVTDHFKSRGIPRKFNTIKNKLSVHIAETKSLLESTKGGTVKPAMFNSQIESKRFELTRLLTDVNELLSKGQTSKQHNKSLIRIFEKHIQSYSNSLEKVQQAKSQTELKRAVAQLGQKINKFNAKRKTKSLKLREGGRPGGMSHRGLGKKDTKGKSKNKKKNKKKDKKPKNKNKQAKSSSATKTPKLALLKLLKAGLDIFVPLAHADNYQQPPTPPQAVSCYNDSADFASNLSTDLNLTASELEVDASIDQVAYDSITALAHELEYSPLKMVEYVTNEMRVEYYHGSVKGASGTLTSGGGNDIDHASLLVALLRASGYPARYVHGDIYLQDKNSHLDWWGVKDFTSLISAVLQSNKLNPASNPTGETIDGIQSIPVPHTWVEACLPYGNYRGDGKENSSYRWVQIDTSFKSHERVDGITVNHTFNYDEFLSERSNKLPVEHFAEQLLEKARETNPNVILDDIGTYWEQKHTSFEFITDSLPFLVKSVDAVTPTLSNTKKAFVFLQLEGASEFSLPMTDFAQHRITLSFEGTNSSDAQKYLDFLNGNILLEDCSVDNLNLRPVFRVDGASILNMPSYTLCSGNDHRQLWLKMVVKVDGRVVSNIGDNTQSLQFDTISLLDYYALNAYAFNGSDNYIRSRSLQLLDALNDSNTPAQDLDNTLGEFLHVALIKYMENVTAANLKIGRLNETTGRSGHHIGLTSTRANVEYFFDLPYAMQSNDFVVDVPGGLDRSVNIAGGGFNFDASRLNGYTASHLESLIWQEYASKDAVSTVSGLQIAASSNNEVQSFTNVNALKAFIRQCDAQNNIVDECYLPGTVANIESQFLSNASNKVTIAKKPVAYKNWSGPVYVVENIFNSGGASFGFPISAYSGGYTVETQMANYFSSFTANYSTGFDMSAGAVATSNNGSTISELANSGTAQAVKQNSLNSGIGNGNTKYNTTAFDPVNMVTGNMYHEEMDISLAARGLPLIFNRTFNSTDSEKTGPLGNGWVHSLQQKIAVIDTDNDGNGDTIVWTNSSGSEKYIGLEVFIDYEEYEPDYDGEYTYYINDPVIPDGFNFSVEYSEGTFDFQNGWFDGFEIKIIEKNGLTFTFELADWYVGAKAYVASIKDVHNNTLSFTYGTNNRLLSVKDPDNRTLSFEYYPNKNLIHKVNLDWANQTHEYFYDANDNLRAYRNPLDRIENRDTTSYEYYSASDGHNLENKMKSFEYANGYKMTFEYYLNGKTYRHYNALGETATFSYNEFRRESTTVNELGRKEYYTFNKDGLLTEFTDALGGKSYYRFEDPNDPMLRTRETDPMGYNTDYSYDADKNLSSETLPSGATVTYQHYNAFGSPQLIKNARGHYRIHKYDVKGNLTDTVMLKEGHGANISPASFNPEANADKIIAWTRNEYDANGKLTLSRQVKDFANKNSGPYTVYDYTDNDNNTEGVVVKSISYYGDANGDGVFSANEGLGTYASTFDALGRPLTSFGAGRYPVSMQYDIAGRLKESSDPLGGTRFLNYDASGLPTGSSLMGNVRGEIVLADSNATQYDLVNRPIQSIDSSGAITSLEYDAAGNVKKVTSPDGYTTYFDFDAKNRVILAYDEEGNAVERVLDLIGRLKKLIDPNGNETVYEYYGPEKNGKVKRVTDAEGRWTEFDYNEADLVSRVVDSSGRETLSFYDELGRVKRVAGPVYSDIVLGNVRPLTSYRYNSLGFRTHVYAGYTNSAAAESSDYETIQSTTEYDDFGRVWRTKNAQNHVWEVLSYDAHDNVTSSRDPLGRTTTSQYGDGGVLLNHQVTGTSGTLTTSYLRNALGQAEQISSANVTYDYEFDTAHRLTKVTDSRGGKYVEYDYSLGGMLNSISDSEGNKTSYLYDPVGRLTGIGTPNNELISYVYDAGGRLQQKIFPNDLVTAYEYFNDNKVKSITTRKFVAPPNFSGTKIPAKIEAEFFTAAYDTTPGNLGDAVCTFSDDVDAQESNDTGGGCHLAFTTAGEWTSYDIYAPQDQTYTLTLRASSARTGKSVHIELDGVDVSGPINIGTGGWNAFANFTVNFPITKGEHTLKVVFDTGDINLNYLDISGNLNSDDNILLQQLYTYNAAGETETVEHSGGIAAQKRRFVYDGVGRLTQEINAQNNAVLDNIAYDPYGNRRQRSFNGVTHFYNNNNLHQINDIRTGSHSGSVVSSFAYDDVGNMLSKTSTGITTSIQYDALDRAISVSKTGLATELYAYDHATMRIQKTVGSAALNYHYSGPDIIAEYDNNWTAPIATYAHGAGMDDPLLRYAANDEVYYHADGLNSIVATSNTSGSIISENRYSAWGLVNSSTGTTPQYGYTGREPNANGLIYYRARFYDPEVGRFTQMDPAGFIDGVNTYAYVLNSPVNYIDPWGLSAAKGNTITGGGSGYPSSGATSVGGASGHGMSPFAVVTTVNAMDQGKTPAWGLKDAAIGTAIPLATVGAGLCVAYAPCAAVLGTGLFVADPESGGGIGGGTRAGTKAATNLTSGTKRTPAEPAFDPRGTAGAAKAFTSVKGRLKAAKLPTTGKIRFVPRKGYDPSNPLPRGPNGGFLDRFNNEWTRGPSRTKGQEFEWDVQLSRTGKSKLGWATRDGSHANVSLDGRITHR